jgi:hypothetical protein
LPQPKLRSSFPWPRSSAAMGDIGPSPQSPWLMFSLLFSALFGAFGARFNSYRIFLAISCKEGVDPLYRLDGVVVLKRLLGGIKECRRRRIAAGENVAPRTVPIGTDLLWH